MRARKLKKILKWLIIIYLIAGLLDSIERTTDSRRPENTPATTVESTVRTVTTNTSNKTGETKKQKQTSFSLENIPDYSGTLAVIVNNNKTYFTKKQMTAKPVEEYSELDSLGRCGTAYASICKELMPTEERGAIGMVKPSGWHNAKYAGIDGNYIYNRCHLIAYMLAGENANEKNLITGTRMFNTEGMLPYEITIANYIQDNPENHVMYRVTPIFHKEELVARGVLMEAKSVEDNGALEFCVFVYNVQPGCKIDYATGYTSGPAYE